MVLWKDKIDKPLARLIRKKRERIQISKIRNGKGEVTNESTEIPRIIKDYYEQLWASLVAQMVKSLPAVHETQVRSLDQEDPLKKEMATHSVFLPGKSHGWRSLAGYSPGGRKELDTTERLCFHYKQLYANKMDNLEVMDKLLERYSLPRLNQEE